MCVPSRFAVDLKAAHGLIPADQVLDGSRENVVDTWFAIRGGRAFVKGVVRRGVPGLHTFFKRPALFPVIENLLFKIRQAHFVGYRLEHLANVTQGFCAFVPSWFS